MSLLVCKFGVQRQDKDKVLKFFLTQNFSGKKERRGQSDIKKITWKL